MKEKSEELQRSDPKDRPSKNVVYCPKHDWKLIKTIISSAIWDHLNKSMKEKYTQAIDETAKQWVSVTCIYFWLDSQSRRIMKTWLLSWFGPNYLHGTNLHGYVSCNQLEDKCRKSDSSQRYPLSWFSATDYNIPDKWLTMISNKNNA